MEKWIEGLADLLTATNIFLGFVAFVIFYGFFDMVLHLFEVHKKRKMASRKGQTFSLTYFCRVNKNKKRIYLRKCATKKYKNNVYKHYCTDY